MTAAQNGRQEKEREEGKEEGQEGRLRRRDRRGAQLDPPGREGGPRAEADPHAPGRQPHEGYRAGKGAQAVTNEGGEGELEQEDGRHRRRHDAPVQVDRRGVARAPGAPRAAHRHQQRRDRHPPEEKGRDQLRKKGNRVEEAGGEERAGQVYRVNASELLDDAEEDVGEDEGQDLEGTQRLGRREQTEHVQQIQRHHRQRTVTSVTRALHTLLIRQFASLAKHATGSLAVT